MPRCQICRDPCAKMHFGAMSCRACGAFFRRCILSKKLMIFCNCLTRKDDQYPCRLCRMEKCLEVGMRAEKIQGSRDINNQHQGPQIQCAPQLHAPHRITTVIQNYSNLKMRRAEIFKSDKKRKVNLHEFSLEVKMDVKLLWRLCEGSFREFDELEKRDKKTLFFNFHTKWTIMEMLMTSSKNNDPFNIYSPSGSQTKPINEFYTDSGKNGNLSGDEKMRIFEPIWKFRIQNLLCPLVKLKLDLIQNMALFGILLWDPGYSNLDESLSKKCYAMRKIILRELKFYMEDKEEEKRFFETLETLGILEKAEQKCHEELELCGVYNLAVDEEMKNMAMREKY